MSERQQRLESIRTMRDRGQILGEIFDAGFDPDEIVEALGAERLAYELGIDHEFDCPCNECVFGEFWQN